MVYLKFIRESYGKAYELPSDCILGHAPLDDVTWQIPYSLIYQTELCSAHINDRFVVKLFPKKKTSKKKKQKIAKSREAFKNPSTVVKPQSTLRTLIFKPDIPEIVETHETKPTDVDASHTAVVALPVVQTKPCDDTSHDTSDVTINKTTSRKPKTTESQADTDNVVLDDDYILLPTNWPFVDTDTTSECSETTLSEIEETPSLENHERDETIGVIDLSDVSTDTNEENTHSSDEDDSISIIRPASSVSVPTISIIMTTYNCIKYIEHAIRSLQSQTMTNWELVVVDDRSTDGTDAILRELAEEDDRIVYLHNRHNVGCYASKNTALGYVRGDWLTFHDADDHSMSERLEKQLRFCTTGSATIEYDSTKVRPYDACYVKSLSRQSKTWSWVPITLFIQTSVFKERLGAFDTIRFGADSEMFSRLRCLSLRVGLLQDYLYACPDRWIELSSRTTSLTGNTKNDPIREIYKAAFDRAHYHYIHNKEYARMHVDKLHYPFPPLYDQDTSQRTVPFPIIGLDPQYESILFPKRKHILENLALNKEAE